MIYIKFMMEHDLNIVYKDYGGECYTNGAKQSLRSNILM
jgi:hypothetical protein